MIDFSKNKIAIAAVICVAVIVILYFALRWYTGVVVDAVVSCMGMTLGLATGTGMGIKSKNNRNNKTNGRVAKMQRAKNVDDARDFEQMRLSQNMEENRGGNMDMDSYIELGIADPDAGMHNDDNRMMRDDNAIDDDDNNNDNDNLPKNPENPMSSTIGSPIKQSRSQKQLAAKSVLMRDMTDGSL